MSTLPIFSMRDLLEAGVHFGHKTQRWNPKMAQYIYGERNTIHIIDLQQTYPMLYRALEKVREVSQKNGRILFVGTKHQASDIISEYANSCGQYFVNHRWLGGLLTNWHTVSQSIKTLRSYEDTLALDKASGLTKTELVKVARKRDKLERSLGGIKNMGSLPDLIFIVDVVREHLAIDEAKIMGIPVIAIADTNADPEGIDYVVPGNDDSVRAIQFYCKLISDSALSGLQENMAIKAANKPEAKSVTFEEPAAVAVEEKPEPKADGKKKEVVKTDKKAELAKLMEAAKK